MVDSRLVFLISCRHSATMRRESVLTVLPLLTRLRSFWRTSVSLLKPWPDPRYWRTIAQMEPEIQRLQSAGIDCESGGPMSRIIGNMVQLFTTYCRLAETDMRSES